MRRQGRSNKKTKIKTCTHTKTKTEKKSLKFVDKQYSSADKDKDIESDLVI